MPRIIMTGTFGPKDVHERNAERLRKALERVG